jgi:hypothetical protein
MSHRQADQLAVAVRSPVATQEDQECGGVEMIGQGPGFPGLIDQSEVGGHVATIVSLTVGPIVAARSAAGSLFKLTSPAASYGRGNCQLSQGSREAKPREPLSGSLGNLVSFGTTRQTGLTGDWLRSGPSQPRVRPDHNNTSRDPPEEADEDEQTDRSGNRELSDPIPVLGQTSDRFWRRYRSRDSHYDPAADTPNQNTRGQTCQPEYRHLAKNGVDSKPGTSLRPWRVRTVHGHISTSPL